MFGGGGVGGHPGLMIPNGGMTPFASTPPTQSLAGSPHTVFANALVNNGMNQYWNAAFNQQQRQVAVWHRLWCIFGRKIIVLPVYFLFALYETLMCDLALLYKKKRA